MASGTSSAMVTCLGGLCRHRRAMINGEGISNVFAKAQEGEAEAEKVKQACGMSRGL